MENQEQEAKNGYQEIFLCEQDHPTGNGYMQKIYGLSAVNKMRLEKGLGKCLIGELK